MKYSEDTITIKGIEFHFEAVWHKGWGGSGVYCPDFWTTNFYRLHDHGMRQRKFLWWKWQEPYYEDEFCFWIDGRLEDYSQDELKEKLEDEVEGYLEIRNRREQIKNKHYV